MKGGLSGCSGIILYDTDKQGDFNAVYGYYDEKNEIVLKKGLLNDLKQQKKEREAPYREEKHSHTKIIFCLFFAMLAAVIAAFIFLPMVFGFALLAFCVISYFPILVIWFTNINTWKDEATKRQFRRFHGCEHAVIHHCTRKKSKDWSLDALKQATIYDGECGTAYCGYAIAVAIVIALLIINIASLGFFKAIGLLLLFLILLFANLFNPYNPFKLLQRPAIARPTDREYRLGIAVADALWDVLKEENT